MRRQIAAANWKMNLTLQQAESLLDQILSENLTLPEHGQVVFAVPFPYLSLALQKLTSKAPFAIAAQNCSDKKSGAFTGEVSAEMLQSLGVRWCVVGHSERREYFGESDAVLAAKVDTCLQHGLTPIFCCGEPLPVRENAGQNAYVQQQLEKALFHLSPEQLQQVVIAYEPIWAIGTGKTATTQQAQEMHHHLRTVLAGKYGQEVANNISILYGGSVKAANAQEIFGAPDVDGGLVGGASLQGPEFVQIIKALKK